MVSLTYLNALYYDVVIYYEEKGHRLTMGGEPYLS